MTKAIWIAAANVRRLIRDRSNYFFVFIFPIATVLLIGATFGSGSGEVIGVFDGDRSDLSTVLGEALDEAPRVDIKAYPSEADLLIAVERSMITAGVVVPAGFESDLAAGQTVTVGYLARPDGAGPQLQARVDQILAAVTAPVDAARFAASHGAASYEEALTTARSLAAVGGVEVVTTQAGDTPFPETLGRFDLGASSQLLLFMFITGLAGSAVMIQSRQLGITSRMLATPTSVRQIVIGEGLGRFGVVLLQGLYIMVATLLLFRVNWGNPWGAGAVLLLFAAVGAGAAVLMGSVFRNDQQAGGVGVVVALGLGALGGCMLPIELFPPGLATVAKLTPHAWANQAFADLVRHQGTFGDILPELGVLALFAAVLVGLASWRLRRVITRP